MKTQPKPKRLLVIVDMVNGFVEAGALADPSIQRIMPKIIETMKEFLAAKEPVLAFLDAHQSDAIEFQTFPVHCLDGTRESELADALLPYQDQLILVKKNSTNGFFAQGFQEYLKANFPLSEVLITGCCTDICVLQFALSLKTYCNQNDWPTHVSILKDGVDTFDLPGHDKKTYNDFALSLLAGAGIEII